MSREPDEQRAGTVRVIELAPAHVRQALARCAEAVDLAHLESEYQRSLDRSDELHADARGRILRKQTRAEKREMNRYLWRTQRKTMRSMLDLPKPGKFWWRIVDYEEMPIERLKPYLDPRAIEAAIAVAISMGLRELSGVQIVEDIGGEDERSRSAEGGWRAATDHHRRGAAFRTAYDRRADLRGFTRRKPRQG